MVSWIQFSVFSKVKSEPICLSFPTWALPDPGCEGGSP